MDGYSEIYTKVDYKNHPFKKYQKIVVAGQTFDKEKITVKRKGKIQNVYDWTQATAKQNDVYAVLDKYNGDMTLAEAELVKKREALGNELVNIKSLDDIQELNKRATELWEGLSLETRAEFQNKRSNFITYGQEWIQKKNQSYYNMLKKQEQAIQEAKERYKKEQELSKGSNN